MLILNHNFKGIVHAGREGMARTERGHSSAWLAATLFSLFCPQAHVRVPSTWCVGLPPSVNILWKCLSRQTEEVHGSSVLSDSELTVKISHHGT